MDEIEELEKRLVELHRQRDELGRGRAQRIAKEVVAELSRRNSVPEPSIVFQPMEETEAMFEYPSTLAISDDFERIVDTAQTIEWDRFLRAVTAHEFKHYLQSLKLGRSLEEISYEEYEKLEREAGMFGFGYAGVTPEEFTMMRTWAATISKLHWVDKIPIREAIEKARAELKRILGE